VAKLACKDLQNFTIEVKGKTVPEWADLFVALLSQIIGVQNGSPFGSPPVNVMERGLLKLNVFV
jgi:hypothetical protein